MRTRPLPVLALAICATAIATSAVLPAAAEPTPREITVTGSATVNAVPDIATVTAGVETQAPTATAALKANSDAMASVFTALETAGVGERDMQTSELSLNPVFQSDPDGSGSTPQVVAYQASNLVTVLVRDVARLGTTIDALAEAGANRLYGVSFDIDEPGAALDEAQQAAVADARRKAELLATAAGVRLGPVISISEGGGRGPMPMRARMGMAMEAPVASGTVELGADVTVIFALAD